MVEEQDGNVGTEEETESLQDSAPLEFPDEAVNLLPYLKKVAATDETISKFLKEKMPDIVRKRFDQCIEGRSEWIEKLKELQRLWLGAIIPKKEPFKNAANMHIPMLLKTTLRLAFRLHGELFREGRPLFSVHATNAGVAERAEILSKFENWQFTKEIPNFEREVLRAGLQFFRDGEATFYSYRDVEKGVNRHEALSNDEFVYPYTYKTTAPDMSDVPYKFIVSRRQKRELRDLSRNGYYDKDAVDKVLKEAKGSDESELEEILRDTSDEHEGENRREYTEDSPIIILEFWGWIQFPRQDREVPVRIAQEISTDTVLGVYRREYDDPNDRIRYDRETADLQRYQSEVEQHLRAMEMEQQVLQAVSSPAVDPMEASRTIQAMQAQRPIPPQRPTWMKLDEATGMPLPPAPCKQIPIEPFSHAVCIENINGNHGIGFGTMLMPHQIAANIMLNQFIDQATLNNSYGGLIHENVKLPSGMTTLNPNEWIRVKGVPIDSVEKAMFPYRPPLANGQLLDGLRMQLGAADDISSAPDVMSGEKEGAETFRGTATRIEQATKQLAVPARAFIGALTQVAKNNGRINHFWLPADRTVTIRNPATEQEETIHIGRDMYRDDYDVAFSADMRFISRAAEIGESDDILGMLVKGFPAEIAGLIFKPQIFSEAARMCLKARGASSLLVYVRSDAEVDQEVMRRQQAQQQQIPPPPPNSTNKKPGPPPMPRPIPPSIPTGAPNATPGMQPPQTQRPVGTPEEAAPGR